MLMWLKLKTISIPRVLHRWIPTAPSFYHHKHFTPYRPIHIGRKNQNVAMSQEQFGSQFTAIDSDDDFDDEALIQMIADKKNKEVSSNVNNDVTMDYSDSLDSMDLAELNNMSERWATQQMQHREQHKINSSPPPVKPADEINSPRFSNGPIDLVQPTIERGSNGSDFPSHPAVRKSSEFTWPSSPSYQQKPTRNITFAPVMENYGGERFPPYSNCEGLQGNVKEEEEDFISLDVRRSANYDDEEEDYIPLDVRRNPKRNCTIQTKEELECPSETKKSSEIVDNITAKVGDLPPPFLSSEQRQVLQKVLGGSSIFFTGSAGTGKSVLLREIIKSLKKKFFKPNFFKNIPGTRSEESNAVAVTASTGLAACNIGGITLHRFAGIGLGRDDAEQMVKKVKRNRKVIRRWKSVRVLIIDEVSMVDGELFDKLEYVARKIRRNETPFGGIQLVLTGDFFQLPPVPEKDKIAKFAFEAETWPTVLTETYQLCKVFRQKDNTFSTMLNQMRTGQMTQETIEAFERHCEPLTQTGQVEATELFPRKADVERANNKRLESLKGDKVIYSALDNYKDDYLKQAQLLENTIAPKQLAIKEGAQVMSIKNIDETLVNGSVGTVVGFMDENTYHGILGDEYEEDDENESIFGKHPPSFRSLEDSLLRKLSALEDMEAAANYRGTKYPLVRFQYPDGTFREVLLSPEKWTIEDYDGKVLASREQVPLILAWALSIHKAQGQTLQYVKVDLNRAFEKGQAYVALSRATSLEGLQVLGFSKSKVMVHPKVIEFYESLKTFNNDA